MLDASFRHLYYYLLTRFYPQEQMNSLCTDEKA